MSPMSQHIELRLYGHRGAPAHAPENTIAAFERALADGANALELDIHATCDGHFVVAHDPDGWRMAGNLERIAEVTLDRVRRWRLGPDGQRMPTLYEVLESFAGVPMSIDLKPDRPEAVPPLLEVLSRYGAEDDVTLASFNTRVVREIRRRGYRGRTTLSRAEVALLRFLPLAIARRRIAGQAAHVPVRHGAVRLDGGRFTARCRALGLRLEYWTIDEPHEARRLLETGATGIMTDDPAAIAPVFRERTGDPTSSQSRRRRRSPHEGVDKI